MREGEVMAQYPIQVLADMIDEFDAKQPKPGRETTAFIMRWKRKELKAKHHSHDHLDEAVRGINRAEIQNIRETKHWRDEQKKRNSEGRKYCNPKRRMIRDGTFAVEREA